MHKTAVPKKRSKRLIILNKRVLDNGDIAFLQPKGVPMSVDLAPRDVAGVLDQLYRAANGVPRRFYLRSEDLRMLSRRERSLRPEFFEETARQLEVCYSILMSYPRLGRGGVLGFVSLRIAENWPAAPEGTIREALLGQFGSDWAPSVRRRIQKLYELVQGDLKSPRPIVITQKQLCRMAFKRRFDQNWWLEILSDLSKVSENERLIFFLYEKLNDTAFIITHEDFVEKWFNPRQEHWVAALKRYQLDEDDGDASPR
jgi:hypothetical protein